MIPNVRFNVPTGDAPIVLTLRPGQTLRHYAGGPTDEGWSSCEQAWFFDPRDQCVYLDRVNDGSDCDGRLTHSVSVCCHASRLAAHHGRDGNRYPKWEQLRASQRDYSAEAAGY